MCLPPHIQARPPSGSCSASRSRQTARMPPGSHRSHRVGMALLTDGQNFHFMLSAVQLLPPSFDISNCAGTLQRIIFPRIAPDLSGVNSRDFGLASTSVHVLPMSLLACKVVSLIRLLSKRSRVPSVR